MVSTTDTLVQPMVDTWMYLLHLQGSKQDTWSPQFQGGLCSLSNIFLPPVGWKTTTSNRRLKAVVVNSNPVGCIELLPCIIIYFCLNSTWTDRILPFFYWCFEIGCTVSWLCLDSSYSYLRLYNFNTSSTLLYVLSLYHALPLSSLYEVYTCRKDVFLLLPTPTKVFGDLSGKISTDLNATWYITWLTWPFQVWLSL